MIDSYQGLDFQSKTFFSLNIMGKNFRLVKNWLSGQVKRVVVNGVAFTWWLIISGFSLDSELKLVLSKTSCIYNLMKGLSASSVSLQITPI